MESLKLEIEKLEEQLKTTEPDTMGYTLMQIELKEKQMLVDSLNKLF